MQMFKYTCLCRQSHKHIVTYDDSRRVLSGYFDYIKGHVVGTSKMKPFYGLHSLFENQASRILH